LEEFNKDPQTLSGRKVVLKQSDFDNGTVRIRYSGWYQLGENIVFNPNRGFGFKVEKELVVCDNTLSGGNNWFPTRKQLETDYDKVAYQLGFFAAITVETKEVWWIDLNGFSISQSPEHRWAQAFYSHIELADQPFIPMASGGPVSFGDQIDSAENGIISGGTLGLSAHHAIHGNGNSNILIQDLTIQEYELAGISLNDFRNVMIDRVKLNGNDTKSPTFGTFSSLRFMDLFTEMALRYSKDAPTKCELENKLALSKLVQQQVFYNTVLGKKRIIGAVKKIKGLNKSIKDNFINVNGLIDGNSYGLLFNRPDVAVNSFAETEIEYKSRGLMVKDVEINGTVGHIREIVALNRMVKDNDKLKMKVIVGPGGNILQIDKITDEKGHYKYSILSDYKITFGKVVSELPDEHQKHFTTRTALHMPAELYNWIKGDKPLEHYIVMNKYVEKAKEGEFVRSRNSDAMNHHNRGVTAIRIDGVLNASFVNVKVLNTRNDGEHGNYDRYYFGAKDGGHVDQSGNEPNLGFMGADTRAVGLFAVRNVIFDGLEIDGVTSKNGKSVGIDIQSQSFDVKILNSKLDNIVAYQDNKLKEGPSHNTNQPMACGIQVGPNTINTVLNNVVVGVVKTGSIWARSTKFNIQNDSTIISGAQFQEIPPIKTINGETGVIDVMDVVKYKQEETKYDSTNDILIGILILIFIVFIFGFAWWIGRAQTRSKAIKY